MRNIRKTLVAHCVDSQTFWGSTDPLEGRGNVSKDCLSIIIYVKAILFETALVLNLISSFKVQSGLAPAVHTTGDKGVSRLVSVLLSSASLSLSLLLSLTKHTCRLTPL